HADWAKIEGLIWGGATFEAAATAVGCSTKSIQRFLAATGGLKRRLKPRSPLRLSPSRWRNLAACLSRRWWPRDWRPDTDHHRLLMAGHVPSDNKLKLTTHGDCAICCAAPQLDSVFA